MEQKVIFYTAIGRIEFMADMRFSIDFEKFESDDVKERAHAIEAQLEFQKPSRERMLNYGSAYDTHLLDFSLVVMHDIDELKKQNERNDARHQVDLKSLEIYDIWISDNTFRIHWKFTDCYGTDRLFAGFIAQMHKSEHTIYRDSEVSFAKPVYLQVYF